MVATEWVEKQYRKVTVNMYCDSLYTLFVILYSFLFDSTAMKRYVTAH